ncbi:HEPN domain-containing protein [Moorella sp. E306M]|uniref:HEPN domain-containing protein n=1 Tax=Moorella sp. E306M TaxID=2572683 RepID=UPI00155B206D|nr:HEPN domain-containing protein [Moorella sp. E306M]
MGEVLWVSPEVKEWMEQAEYDFSTAKAMFHARKYLYMIYMCQLALEKILKAVVALRTDKTPPKTHKLLLLVKLGQVNLVEEHLEFLGTLDAIGSGARYPKDLAAARKTYSRNVAQDYLVKTKEILEWIKKDQIFKQL